MASAWPVTASTTGRGDSYEADTELGASAEQVAGLLRSAGHDRQVEPGGELALTSGDDDGLGLVGLGTVQRSLDAAQHGVAEGVRLAVVDGDGRDIIDQRVADVVVLDRGGVGHVRTVGADRRRFQQTLLQSHPQTHPMAGQP